MAFETFLGVALGILSIAYGYIVYDNWRNKK